MEGSEFAGQVAALPYRRGSESSLAELVVEHKKGACPAISPTWPCSSDVPDKYMVQQSGVLPQHPDQAPARAVGSRPLTCSLQPHHR